MALQINTTLTTQSGLTVPAGSYCWLIADFGNDFEYKARYKMIFFKDKPSFDQKKSRFDPAQIPIDQVSQNFTPQLIGGITYMDIHNHAKAYLETLLGANAVTIVQ